MELLKTWLKISFTLVIFLFAACSFWHEKTDPELEARRLEKLVGPNFTSLNQYIFQPKCARCHNEPTKKNHQVVLTSYQTIVNSNVFPPLIVPGEPEQSSIYKVVESGKMPKDSKRLPDHVVKMLFEWIKAGALENGASQACESNDLNCADNPPNCEPDEPGCDEVSICQPDEPGCEMNWN